jgi:hypothetical protein
MKREKLLEKVNQSGAVFLRHGKKHDIYENPRTHELISIPRHSDINEYTARDVIKKLSR